MKEAARVRRGTWRKVVANADLYIMMVPFLALFLLFTAAPVVFSVVLSFTDFNLLQFPDFVGWDNYIRLFLEDKVFIKSLTNTLVFAVVTGPVSYFLSLFVAWLINDLAPENPHRVHLYVLRALPVRHHAVYLARDFQRGHVWLGKRDPYADRARQRTHQVADRSQVQPWLHHDRPAMDEYGGRIPVLYRRPAGRG